MELASFVASLPAVIAFTFKVVLLAYAYKSPVQNRQTTLFLLLLFTLSLQNIAEISSFYTGSASHVPALEGYVYFAASIVILALAFHLSLTLAVTPTSINRTQIIGLYLYAACLEVLLLFSSSLVSGFTPLGVSYYRIAGPLYFLFEIYAIGCFVGVIALLAFGASRQLTRQKRLKCQLMLLGMFPMAALVIVNVALMHFGITAINTPVNFPIAVTFFLLVTTYAVHQHRLFDIQFYIPWSKVRKRKTAFYQRIRGMIAEIADLGSGSVNQALDRLADTLRCPVAFIDDTKAVVAAVGAPSMLSIPVNTLRHIDHIIVANEIADAKPETYAVMKQHGVAAIVPFHPHSHSAASWLLLGEAFSDHVYTPRDFRMVEQLFDKMADLFLDKLVAMRTKLADAHLQIQTLKFQVEQSRAATTVLEQRVAKLSRDNLRLVREQTADSLLLAQRPTIAKLSITLLGWNKALRQRLRARFPQLEHYAGPDSASFRRRPLPDVLICEVQTDDRSGQQRKLAELIASSGQRSAVLLMGGAAGDFAMEYRKDLLGKPVEVLPDTVGDDAIERRLSALVLLRESLFTASHADAPLLGVSHVYVDAMAQIHRVARFAEPICIKGNDIDEAIAVGGYIHEISERMGEFRVLRAAHLPDGHTEEQIANVLRGVESGTLMIDSIATLSNEAWDLLLAKTNNFADVRLIAACSLSSGPSPNELFDPLRPMIIELPSLRERREDIPLLVHYYTLQYNLQSGSRSYLSQSNVDDLMASNYPTDLAHLKSTLFAQFQAKAKSAVSAPDLPTDGSEQPLVEHVAEFEKRLIEQTLQRCDGNKSKAARLLGLRPNTLHYKLERYGLLKEKE